MNDRMNWIAPVVVSRNNEFFELLVRHLQGVIRASRNIKANGVIVKHKQSVRVVLRFENPLFPSVVWCGILRNDRDAHGRRFDELRWAGRD